MHGTKIIITDLMHSESSYHHQSSGIASVISGDKNADSPR